jgi:hypothetical protein
MARGVEWGVRGGSGRSEQPIRAVLLKFRAFCSGDQTIRHGGIWGKDHLAAEDAERPISQPHGQLNVPGMAQRGGQALTGGKGGMGAERPGRKGTPWGASIGLVTALPLPVQCYRQKKVKRSERKHMAERREHLRSRSLRLYACMKGELAFFTIGALLSGTFRLRAN